MTAQDPAKVLVERARQELQKVIDAEDSATAAPVLFGFDDLPAFLECPEELELLRGKPKCSGIVGRLEKRAREAIKKAKAEAKRTRAATASATAPARTIFLGPHVHQTVRDAIASLQPLPDVFQQAGRLVRVCGEGPAVVELSPSALVTQMSIAASYMRQGEAGPEACAPPTEIARAIVDGGDYPGVRQLVAVTTVPRLCADGRVVCTPGYDAGSGLWYAGPQIDLPAKPGKDDAVGALDHLLKVVDEFPLQQAADKSAWLAVVLSIVMRPLISGPVPLFCGTANQARLGKSRAMSFAGLIATSKMPAVQTLQTYEEPEWDKTVSSVVLGPNPDAVLIDNVPRGKEIGCATLDAVLTASEATSIRIFGTSESRVVVPRSVWLITSNGAVYRGDTAGRTIPVRLFWPDPHPERREFKVKDIERLVRQRQPALLASALIAARAFVLAEPEAQKLPPLGSYEGWTAVVRQLLVWTGKADPLDTREGIEASDREGDDHDRFVELVWALFEDGEWSKHDLADLVDGVDAPKRSDGQPRRQALRGGWTLGAAQDLLQDLGAWDRGAGLVDRKALGYRLRSSRDRPDARGRRVSPTGRKHDRHRDPLYKIEGGP